MIQFLSNDDDVMLEVSDGMHLSFNDLRQLSGSSRPVLAV